MKRIICDRCTKVIDGPFAQRSESAMTFTVQGWEGDFKSFFKKDRRIDLCDRCFEDFMFFARKPQLGDTMVVGDLIATFVDIKK